MNKKEMVRKYGENMRDFWQILEAMLDDAYSGGHIDGYDDCLREHSIGD